MIPGVNFAVTTLAGGDGVGSTGGTTFVVASQPQAQEFPAVPFVATIQPADASLLDLGTEAEIVFVTAYDGDVTFTVQRAVDGSTARTPAAGWLFYLSLTTRSLQEASFVYPPHYEESPAAMVLDGVTIQDAGNFRDSQVIVLTRGPRDGSTHTSQYGVEYFDHQGNWLGEVYPMASYDNAGNPIAGSGLGGGPLGYSTANPDRLEAWGEFGGLYVDFGHVLMSTPAYQYPILDMQRIQDSLDDWVSDFIFYGGKNSLGPGPQREGDGTHSGTAPLGTAGAVAGFRVDFAGNVYAPGYYDLEGNPISGGGGNWWETTALDTVVIEPAADGDVGLNIQLTAGARDNDTEFFVFGIPDWTSASIDANGTLLLRASPANGGGAIELLDHNGNVVIQALADDAAGNGGRILIEPIGTIVPFSILRSAFSNSPLVVIQDSDGTYPLNVSQGGITIQASTVGEPLNVRNFGNNQDLLVMQRTGGIVISPEGTDVPLELLSGSFASDQNAMFTVQNADGNTIMFRSDVALFGLPVVIDRGGADSNPALLINPEGDVSDAVLVHDSVGNVLMRASVGAFAGVATLAEVSTTSQNWQMVVSDAGNVGPFANSGAAILDSSGQYIALQTDHSGVIVSDLAHQGTQLGFFSAATVSQAAAPTTLGDVIAALTAYGLFAP